MSKYKLIFFISLFSLVIDQQCIFGQNCPYNKGFCVDTRCECIEGFWSLMDKSLPPEQQTFCNYEQISLYIPLFLEFMSPSLGHFYVGKYYFAIIKLLFAVMSLGSGAYLYGTIKVPNFAIIFKNKYISEENLFERKDIGEVLKGNPNKPDDEISTKKKIIEVIFNCSFIPFWIFWGADLYFYFFKVYKDGNGVPFI